MLQASKLTASKSWAHKSNVLNGIALHLLIAMLLRVYGVKGALWFGSNAIVSLFEIACCRRG